LDESGQNTIPKNSNRDNAMSITLPPPISRYFSAANEGRSEDAAACFTAGALVHDEGHDHTGRAAIQECVAETGSKYSPQTEVIRVKESGGAFVVTAKVSGDFPGSPVELEYHFELSGGEISKLQIS